MCRGPGWAQEPKEATLNEGRRVETDPYVMCVGFCLMKS